MIYRLLLASLLLIVPFFIFGQGVVRITDRDMGSTFSTADDNPNPIVAVSGNLAYYTTIQENNRTILYAVNADDLSTEEIFQENFISLFFEYNEEWYFRSHNNDGSQLRRINGTTTEVIYSTDTSGFFSYFINNFVTFQGDLYFSESLRLLRYDGISIEEVYKFDSKIIDLTATESKLILVAGYNTFGHQSRYLFTSDGTTENTIRYYNINEGSEFNSKLHMTPVGEKVFFWFEQNDQKNALFVTDGTESGTIKLKDLRRISFGEPELDQSLIAYNSKFYFIGWSANQSQNSYDFFESDGTVEGTKLVFDESLIEHARGPQFFHIYKDDFIFKVRNTLWNPIWYKITKTNPTPVRFLEDIDISNTYMVDYGDEVLFSATDDHYRDIELFVSDGTISNTRALTDISTDEHSFYPFDLTVVGDKIFFVGEDPEIGRELYVYDPLLSAVGDEEDISNVVIYPSPATDILIVNNLSSGNKKIRIINCLGQIIFDNNYTRESVELSLENFKSGLYYLQVVKGQSNVDLMPFTIVK